MKNSIVAIFLSILLILACAGCGKTETQTTDKQEVEIVEGSKAPVEKTPESESEPDPFPKDTQCGVCGGWFNEIDLVNGNIGDGWKLFCPECYKNNFMGSMLPGGGSFELEEDPTFEEESTIVDILGKSIEEFNEYKAEQEDYAIDSETEDYEFNWSGNNYEGSTLTPDTEVIVVDPSLFK